MGRRSYSTESPYVQLHREHTLMRKMQQDQQNERTYQALSKQRDDMIAAGHPESQLPRISPGMAPEDTVAAVKSMEALAAGRMGTLKNPVGRIGAPAGSVPAPDPMNPEADWRGKVVADNPPPAGNQAPQVTTTFALQNQPTYTGKETMAELDAKLAAGQTKVSRTVTTPQADQPASVAATDATPGRDALLDAVPSTQRDLARSGEIALARATGKTVNTKYGTIQVNKAPKKWSDFAPDPMNPTATTPADPATAAPMSPDSSPSRGSLMARPAKSPATAISPAQDYGGAGTAPDPMNPVASASVTESTDAERTKIPAQPTGGASGANNPPVTDSGQPALTVMTNGANKPPVAGSGLTAASTPLGTSSTSDDINASFAKSPEDDQFKKRLMFTGFSSGKA